MNELEPQGNEPMITCSQRTSNHYRVMISQDFGAVEDYDTVYTTLVEAQEEDTVEFCINSNGGSYDAFLSILAGIQQTQARTIATITGNANSCGSMLSLSCDELRVLPLGTMLVHHASTSMPMSKMNDGMKATLHLVKQLEKSFRLCYTGFLSEEEILTCLEGAEIHLDAAEIEERFEAMVEYRESTLA